MNKSRLIFFIIIALLGILFIVTLFYQREDKSKIKDLPPGTHGVTVTEVIQTTNYTYLLVEENNLKFWIAVVKRDSKAGDVIYYSRAYEMKDFVSKELGRTFPSVFFVQDPSDQVVKAEETEPRQMTGGRGEPIRKTGIVVETPKGGITIADLYKNRASYAEKSVMIRGEVVKYNHEVMHKNWVHIQDGTDYSGKFDLAITTMDSLAIGSMVTFKGIIRLDKDFGAGYVYEIIMEEAKASDIKPVK